MDSQVRGKGNIIHPPLALFHSRINDLALCDTSKDQIACRWTTIKVNLKCIQPDQVMSHQDIHLFEGLEEVCISSENSENFLEINLPFYWHFCLSCPVTLKDFLHKADSSLLKFHFLLVIISLFYLSVSQILTGCQGNNLATRSADMVIGIRRVFKNVKASLI